ncbi:hypothetical protein L596_020610 [Steinernema carpocapsae]|uniref:Uncharacterized protein n=1 Tax=Steinernema carpocapsae TaxID=34508 RepID=A0A4U5MUQ2_STECR|nr:hypothetical protein L596_020610 [Steinernema carpocapsae]
MKLSLMVELCLDDGSCLTPFGICVTETMECMGIDISRSSSLTPLSTWKPTLISSVTDLAWTIEAAPCPMESASPTSLNASESVTLRRTKKTQTDSNMTAALPFEENTLKMPKLDQMKIGEAFSLKTEL